MPNSFHVMHRFPVTGEYVIRATPDNGAVRQGRSRCRWRCSSTANRSAYVSIDGQLEGRTQEFSVRVTAGEHWIAVGFPKQFEGCRCSTAPRIRRRGPSRRAVAAVAAAAAAAGGCDGRPAGRGGRGGRDRATRNNNNDDAASNVFFTPPGAPPGTRLPRPDNMGVQSIEIGGPHNPEVRPSRRERAEAVHVRRAHARLRSADHRESRAPRVSPSRDAERGVDSWWRR